MKLKTFCCAVLILVGGCRRDQLQLKKLPDNFVPMPAASEIESIVYFVGDMGESTWDHSPLPHRLADEVEAWSGTLKRDSAVAVVFLGDNVYPKGLRLEPQYFPADSMRLEGQVHIVSGKNARAYDAFGLFIAGNHDWGHRPGAEGEARLRNQEEFLTRRRKSGINVQLMPDAGLPGPGIVDVGRHIRILLIDTAWWLLSADKDEKDRTLGRLHDQLASSALDREVIIASHHPYRSASAHGGLVSFWSTVGVEWLLYKSGTTLQDLNSLPYRDFRMRAAELFTATRTPLLYIGGHDHALQLFRATADNEPRFMAVSGSGSKSSKIGSGDGMLFRSPEPGYMQLVVRKNGKIDLFVFSAPSDYLSCERGTEALTQQCLAVGRTEFRHRYSIHLK